MRASLGNQQVVATIDFVQMRSLRPTAASPGPQVTCIAQVLTRLDIDLKLEYTLLLMVALEIDFAIVIKKEG